ncbi:MAG: type IV pilus assembly protein PilM [Armatimonadota bacterium]
MLSSLFGKESILGLDIGSSCIKAAEVVPTAHGWELTQAAVAACPRGTIKDGIITDVHEVASAIRAILREAGIRSTSAVCGVSGSQVIVRQVQFPKMPEAVLRKSIKYEAGKYVSSPIEDSVVEFEIIGDAEEPGQMNVWLVASPREMIDSRVATLEEAGLDPLAIDVEAFALIRSVVELSATDRYLRETIALVDMGASHTDVNVVSRGEFALTRNIPIAGDSFTSAIKNLTGSSFEESEQMKLEMAAMHPLDQLASAESDNRNWKVVQPLLDEMIREIRRSINFYHSQFPEGSTDAFVGRIILTGGTARMPGIDAYLSAKLGIPTEKANVFNDSAISTARFSRDFIDEHQPLLAVCTGLALKELVADAKQKAA